MGLYSPPGKPPNSGKKLDDDTVPSNNSNSNDDSDKEQQSLPSLYTRPSIGLKLWGPLVPASDCVWGMWTLTGIQAVVGFTFLAKFRLSLWRYRLTKPVTKEIATIPSLNRFSTTHGKLKYTPENILQQSAAGQIVPTLNRFGGTHSFSFSNGPTMWQSFWGKWKKTTFGKWIDRSLALSYLLTGSVLFSLSILEASRLALFDYDPWVEQMQSAREKQLYNDTNKFYRDGIDPTKFEVKIKDAATGQYVDATNDPEIRAHIAMARALMVRGSWMYKWFGPLDLQPLSVKEYLDKIEQYEVNKMAAQETFHLVDPRLAIPLSEAKQNLAVFSVDSETTRHKTLELLKNIPPNTLTSQINAQNGSGNGALDRNNSKKQNLVLPPEYVKVFPVNCTEAKQIQLGYSWLYNDPWAKLGMETQLAVKYIPSTPTYYKDELDNFGPQEKIGDFTINNDK